MKTRLEPRGAHDAGKARLGAVAAARGAASKPGPGGGTLILGVGAALYAVLVTQQVLATAESSLGEVWD